jgi:ribosomal protein L37E
MIANHSKARYYFVCLRCNSKWFAAVTKMNCPRCGKPCESKERLIPLWLANMVNREQDQP